MKAYDLKVLLEKLKSNGLEVGEESAKCVAKSVLEWVKESAQESDNKFDDILAVIIPLLEKPIEEALDKINPEG